VEAEEVPQSKLFLSFTYGLDGELDPIVSSVVYAIKLGKDGTIEQDGWRFTISKDGKFLQRSRHSQTKVVDAQSQIESTKSLTG